MASLSLLLAKIGPACLHAVESFPGELGLVSWRAKTGPNNAQNFTSGIVGVMWRLPEMWVPENGCFTMDNPTKMDDLGIPSFMETLIRGSYHWVER